MITLILILILIFLLLIASKIKNSLVRKILIIYLGWWAFALILSSFNLYNLVEVDFSIYILLLVNVMFFTVGYISIPFSISNKRDGLALSKLEVSFERNLKSKYVKIILFVLTVYTLIKTKKYLGLLAVLTESNVRLVKYKPGLLFASGQEVIFYNYFIESAAFFAGIFISYCLVFRKFKYLVFYLSILLYCGYSVIGAGRGPIIMLFLYFIFLNLIKNYLVNGTRTQKISKVRLKGIVIGAPLGLIVMSFQTAYRAGYTTFNLTSLTFGLESLSRHLVVYTTGAFRALQYAIDKHDYLQYSFGKFSLLGMEDILLYLGKFIGVNYNSFTLELSEVLTETFVIGNNGETFNALFTCVFPFYTDFGVVGVIFFAFILGRVFRKVLNNFLKSPNYSNLLITILFCVISVYSLFTWRFSVASPYIIILLLFLTRYKFTFK